MNSSKPSITFEDFLKVTDWSKLVYPEISATYRIADGRIEISEDDIIDLYDNAEELKKLVEEQPAVREAWEKLQTLVKLYKA